MTLHPGQQHVGIGPQQHQLVDAQACGELGAAGLAGQRPDHPRVLVQDRAVFQVGNCLTLPVLADHGGVEHQVSRPGMLVAVVGLARAGGPATTVRVGMRSPRCPGHRLRIERARIASLAVAVSTGGNEVGRVVAGHSAPDGVASLRGDGGAPRQA